MQQIARIVAVNYHLYKLTEEINLRPEDIREVISNQGETLGGLMATMGEEQGVSDEECLEMVKQSMEEFCDIMEASQETLQ
jgi:hypothetical protein